jgi:hypothetical protein
MIDKQLNILLQQFNQSMTEEEGHAWMIRFFDYVDAMSNEQDKKAALDAYFGNLLNGLQEFAERLHHASPQQLEALKPDLDLLIAEGLAFGTNQAKAA